MKSSPFKNEGWATRLKILIAIATTEAASSGL
jgi:hypothetical protein